MKKWVIVTIVLLFLTAAGLSSAASPGDSPAAAPGVLPRAPGIIAPPDIPPPEGIAGGRRDYRGKCAICHGANALSTMKTARKLGVDPRKLALMSSEMGREEMIAITTKGKDKMPGFEKDLTKERIASVIDYILDFRAKRVRKDSLIRQKAPVTPEPAPAETSEKKPAAP